MCNKKVLSLLMTTMIGSVGISGFAAVPALASSETESGIQTAEAGLADVETTDVWGDLTDIPIDESFFPDEAFRQYILEIEEVRDDGSLSKEEAQKVTEIKVEGCGSVEGIEYFSHLESLSVLDGNLTELDISHNTELQVLELENAYRFEIDTSMNPVLESVVVYEVPIAQDASDETLDNRDVVENVALSEQEELPGELDQREKAEESNDQLAQTTDAETVLNSQSNSTSVSLQSSVVSQPITKEEAEVAADKAKRAAEQASADEIAAKNAVETAKTEVNDTKDAIEKAYSDTEDAFKDAKTKAGLNVSSARNDYERVSARQENAQTAYDNASKRLVDAEAALATAQGLKDGTVDIKNTAEYKAEQEAKSALNAANIAMNTTNSEASAAQETFDNTQKNLTNKTDALTNAKHLLSEAQKDLSAKEKEQKSAADALENAKTEYNNAKTAADKAAKSLTEAKEKSDQANTAVKTAETNKTKAEDELADAKAKQAKAKQNAAIEVDQQISNAQTAANTAETAMNTAKDALDEKAQIYNQGMMGFIDWMFAKTNLNEEQKADLVKAKEKLIAATEENLSSLDKYCGYDLNNVFGLDRSGKTVVIGDEHDSTSIRNIKIGIEIMRNINQYRATDNNFVGDMAPNPATTNFYYMVFAQVQTMRSASALYHTNYSGINEECLSFGYPDPAKAWYDEKEYFDQSKEELGIEEITSAAEVRAISRNATGVVGHYTGLLECKDQIMGAAWTQYCGTAKYGATSSYDAKKITSTDVKYGLVPYSYTIDEFESLFNEYLETLNIEKLQEAYDKTYEEYESAKQKLDTLKSNRDVLIAEAIEEKTNLVKEKEAEVKKATEVLTQAKDTAEKAKKVFEQASDEKTKADTLLEKQTDVYKKAESNAQTKNSELSAAQSAVKKTQNAVNSAQEEYNQASTAQKAAENDLAEKKEKAAEAKAGVEEAKKLYNAAKEKLTELTDDSTLTRLKEERDQAQKEVDEADVKLSEANDQVASAVEKQKEARRQNQAISALTVEAALKTPVTEKGLYLSE